MTIDHATHVLVGSCPGASRLHGDLHLFAEREGMGRDAAVAAGQAVLDDLDTVIAELTAVRKRTAGELADLLCQEQPTTTFRADWIVRMHVETHITVPGQSSGDDARKVARLRFTAGDWGDLATREMPPSFGFVSRVTSADREDM